MQLRTDGIVIKEQSIGESDILVTLLTRDKGVISVWAKNAMRARSKLGTATDLLCYSQFELFHNKERYSVNSAEVKEIFFGLRSDIEKIALGGYFAQLIYIMIPQEEPAEEPLRLLLNALHYLEKDKRPPALIKAVFELRLLALSGFMPDLVGCTQCGNFESQRFYVSPVQGDMLCDRCYINASRQQAGYRIAVDRTVLAGMRHIIYSDFSKLFAFSIPEQSVRGLSLVCEKFMLAQTGRSYPALEFYHSLAQNNVTYPRGEREKADDKGEQRNV